MLLSRENRLTLLETIPFHGDWKYFAIFQKMRGDIGFDNDEIEEWDTLGSKEFDIESASLKEMIRVLDELRANEVITPEQEELYLLLK